MEELTLTQQIKISANAKLQFRQNNAYAYVTDPELLAVMEAIAEVIEARLPKETHVESNTTDGAGAHTDPAPAEPAAGADGTKTVEQGTSNTPS